MFTNEIINTFNLEQNLLTFPSERDILTGGEGSECGERWMARWSSLSCPRVCAHELGYSGPPRRVHLEKLSLAAKMYSRWVAPAATW